MFFEFTNLCEIPTNKEPEIDAFNLVYRGKYKDLCNLIESGTYVDIRNSNDQTLLHYAILYNQFKIAHFLINHKADLNSIDKFGQKVKDIIQERNFTPDSALNTTMESSAVLGDLVDEGYN